RGGDPVERHWDLHGGWGPGGWHLYRSGADADPEPRRSCFDPARHARSRWLFSFAGSAARKLLPHDEAAERSGLPLDGNISGRSDSWHLVLVYGPGYGAARPLRKKRGPC